MANQYVLKGGNLPSLSISSSSLKTPGHPDEEFNTSTDPYMAPGQWIVPGQPFAAALIERLYPVVSPFPKERPPPEPPIVPEPAEIQWGRPSSFSYGTRTGPKLRAEVKVKMPEDKKDDEEEEEPQVPLLTYTEIPEDRKTSTIKVTSKDDPDIWVEVGRIDEITFQGPNSSTDSTIVRKKFVLKHPSQ